MTFSARKHAVRDLVLLVPLSLFFLLYQLGAGSLASWDEAIYASVAANIYRSGDWLNLRFNGWPFTDAPPLAVWVTALFYQLFGLNEFSSRLFSALGGVGCVTATYFIGGKLLSRWAGLLSALVLLSTTHFMRYSRFGMLDAPFAFLFAMCLYFFWMGRDRNRYLVFSGICLGLALMLKGGWALMVFPIVWTYCLFADRVNVLGRSSYWVGVMMAAVIALPWHLYIITAIRNAPAASSGAFQPHTWLEWAADTFGGNGYFYLRILINKFHPWILIAILSGPYFLFKAIKELDEEAVFLSVWMFFIFIFLSILRTKQNSWLLPAYPPIAITVGYVLSKVFTEKREWWVLSGLFLVLILHIPYSHIFDHNYSAAIKTLAPTVRARVPAGRSVGLFRYREEAAFSFYADRISYSIESAEEFIWRAKKEEFFAMIREDDLTALGGNQFLKRWNLEKVAESGHLFFLARKR